MSSNEDMTIINPLAMDLIANQIILDLTCKLTNFKCDCGVSDDKENNHEKANV